MAIMCYKFLPLVLILIARVASYSPPDPLKVLSMMRAYAPLVYFHPEEKYFPSSVQWFFQNGALLQKTGQTPHPVMTNGENLPSTGGADDSFLDLPSDEQKKEVVKKGFLYDAVAYVHAKPALGGMCTDLAIWLYYPFNGGSKFQCGPFVINLGMIGEHVSDWEHITLRIDNVSGALKSIYLSQHSKGQWLAPGDFELVNGIRPVVYSALHSHSHYSTAGYRTHTGVKLDLSEIKMLYDEVHKLNNSKTSQIPKENIFFGVGVRDDTAKSNYVMDLTSAFDITYIDYFDESMVPWLNYTGRWGPKIAYNFSQEVTKATEGLPGPMKIIALNALQILPNELREEEGPQGPKMKDSWAGDERA